MPFLSKKIFLLCALVIAALLFRLDAPRGAVSNFFISAHTIFSSIIEKVAFFPDTVALLFSSRQSYERQKEGLQARIKELENQILIQDELEKDYISLREQLRLLPEASIAARVIFSPGAEPFDSILINKGEKDGIQAGMKAIVSGYVFAGTVKEVFESSARVSLISSFGEETLLTLAEQDTPVVAKGKGAYSLEIDFPRDFNVVPGNRLVFFHDQPLLAGFIEEVRHHTSQSVTRAKAVIPFNAKKITTITVVP